MPDNNLQLSEILADCGGQCANARPAEITGVSIDTRSLKPGELYVALKGERLDGHRFVADAIAGGASYALVDRLTEDAPHSAQILVPDTLAALQRMAAARRMRSGWKVVGITGSVGKTSAKEMMALALSSQCHACATAGNFNNHIGLPLTILRTPMHADALVLEMGMNHAGEIAALSAIARPDAALITTVDAVHLEFFDSVAGIAHAKAEIMDGMEAGTPIVLPRDNPYYDILEGHARERALDIISFGTHPQATWRLGEVSLSPEGTQAEIVARDVLMRIQIGAIGAHQAMNALGVLACAEAMGFELAHAAAALRRYREPKGRGTLETIPWQEGQVTLLDESYNASPASMRAAFARLAAIAGTRRKVAVLGDMRELGEDAPALHAGLAEALQEAGVERVYTVGALMAHLAARLPEAILAGHFDTNAQAASALQSATEPADVILFKASRGSAIEEVMHALSHAAMPT